MKTVCGLNGFGRFGIHLLKYWLENLSSPTKETIDSLTNFCSLNLNIKGKDLFFPLRILLIGQTHGPHLTTIINILGVEETKYRLKGNG